MRMTFTVKYEDGREVVAVAKPKDIVAFERQYGQSMASFGDDTKPVPIEWLYYLAWSPLHRSGSEPRAFDEFLDAVDSIEPVGEEEPITPFPPAVSAGPSPDSP